MIVLLVLACLYLLATAITSFHYSRRLAEWVHEEYGIDATFTFLPFFILGLPVAAVWLFLWVPI